MFGQVLLGERLLLGVRKRLDRVVALQDLVGRRALDADPRHRELGEADVDDAVGADEPERGGAAAAVLEVGDEREREAAVAVGLGIVEQAHDDVVDVAAVIPVALAAHGGDPRRADRAGRMVNAGQQVDEQIAGDGRAVIPVVPPAEEPDRVERAAWGLAQEAVPVDRLRRSVGRDRVLPGADIRVAVVPRLDGVHLAERARADQLLDLVVENRAGVLAADLEDGLGLLLRGDDGRPFVDGCGSSASRSRPPCRPSSRRSTSAHASGRARRSRRRRRPCGRGSRDSRHRSGPCRRRPPWRGCAGPRTGRTRRPARRRAP